MRRRDFIGLSGGFLAEAVLGGQKRMTPRATTRPPNIVLFLIDDMGWKDVGFMGSEYYETPHIDELARSGMVFDNAYANAPNCAPSRACLMSGQYTPRHGIYTVHLSARGKARNRKLIPIKNNTTLPKGTITLAESLHRAGYVSASMGKWHLGGLPDHGPESQGFDLNIAGTRQGSPKKNGYFSPWKFPNLKFSKQGEYLTDRLTDEALEFLDANREQPFFLYLTHYAVHKPLRAKSALKQKYRQKATSQGQNNPTYAAMIESVDESVGRVLNKLDQLGLRENSIVVFFSDNGGVGGYHACGIKASEITSQSPLQGGKGMLYEGGIRVPLAISWPGKIESGTVCHSPVIGTDLYPTFLRAAGLKKEPGQILDGESLWPLLSGSGDLDRKAIYWHFPAYLQANRGDWRTTPATAMRAGPWKLIEFFEDGNLELYNLDRDIAEQHDLSAEMPELVEELHRKMVAWREETEAPVPDQPNPEYSPQREK